MSDRLRVFFGLRPPDETSASLARAIVEASRAAPEMRPSPVTNLHATLLFVGAIERPALPALQEALEVVAAQTSRFTLIATGAGTFGRPQPRVLWAGLEGDVAAAAALAAALAEASGHPLDRPWRGHLTLGRARSRRGDPMLLTACEGLQGRSFGLVPAHKVVLFESRSQPGGVRYLPLASKELAAQD